MSESSGWRFGAYYYGFTPTGDDAVDRILSAVACAGKAYHHTQDWHEDGAKGVYDHLRGDTPQDWIQEAAADAAKELAELRTRLAELNAEVIRLTRERDEARAALADIADDYAERFDMESPSTNPGIKHVYERARDVLLGTPTPCKECGGLGFWSRNCELSDCNDGPEPHFHGGACHSCAGKKS